MYGLLGGTFDPIHLGHLRMAEEACERLQLEGVIFIPAGRPWFKNGRSLSEAYHRLNMVKIAVTSNPLFGVSSIESDRKANSYTVDTLAKLRNEGSYGSSLAFIMGMDSYQTFHYWKKPERIMDLCTVVVVSRPGYKLHRDDLKMELSAVSQKAVILDGLRIKISGTEIRRRVSLGLSIREMVTLEVADYIEKNGLYPVREVGI